jgi:hypothetical protein
MQKFYAFLEGASKDESTGVQEINLLDAPALNGLGFAIFWTVNEFDGARRMTNISEINGFALDLDQGTKDEQMALIKRGLFPSWIIDSKRGYHVYFLFKEPMKVSFSEDLRKQYRAVLQNRLGPFYNADQCAMDLTRMLRVPYFLHQKNPRDPFMVKPIQENDVRYTWQQIESFYEDRNKRESWSVNIKAAKREIKLRKSDKLFDDIYNMNAMEGLERLSGHSAVNNETFSFKPNHNGTNQIYVNGKSTGCWIDRDNRIGSLDKGGPTVWQWLYWYQGNHKRVYQTMKEVFGV